MRTIALIFIAAASVAPGVAAAGTDGPPARTAFRDSIHLDNAAIDAIRHKDPQRYERIAEVLKVAQVEPCIHAPKVLKAQLNVDAKCEAMTVYTSLPAKTALHFSIENTDYSVYIAQEKLSGGTLIPAK